MAIYTEAHHDYYDASQLSESDKLDLDLGEPIVDEDEALELALEKYWSGNFKKMTDKEVLMVVRETQFDDIRDYAVRKGYMPSAEEQDE